MTTQNIPDEVQPFLYINGFLVSNNSTTPNSVLNVSSGQCRDSNDLIDISISSASVINTAMNGLNGLDTGSLAATQLYGIWAIGDSSNYRIPGMIASLSSNSFPLIPYGYDSYRLIGYFSTDGSSNIRLFYNSGNSNSRNILYDAPAQILSGGHSTALTYVSLAGICPATTGVFVGVQISMIPATTGNVVTLGTTTSSTGLIFSFATQDIDYANNLCVNLVSGVPNIAYKTTSSSDTVSLSAIGFSYSV